MTAVLLTSPFGNEPLEEVPLARAPLVLTLAQIRFPSLSVLAGQDAPLRVAEELAEEYPLFKEAREVAIQITPEGVTEMPGGGKLWRLMSADESWQVSFGHSFVSLHTSRYTNREDFCQRLSRVWARFSVITRPPSVQRVGFRYVNRVEEAAFLADLPSMVRTEVLGGSSVDLNGGALLSSFSESLYQVNDADGLQARWGILPPNTVLDPTLPPVERPCWILDLDSFRNYPPGTGSGVDVVAAVGELGRAGYRFFRWSVTENFLLAFGAEL